MIYEYLVTYTYVQKQLEKLGNGNAIAKWKKKIDSKNDVDELIEFIKKEIKAENVAIMNFILLNKKKVVD